MTQAFNLSQLANKVNSSGQLDVSTGLTGSTPVVNGGTGQSTFTNGQLLIGNTTGNTLTKATLTAGTGVTITNGTGSITIAASGGVSSVNGQTGAVVTTTHLGIGATQVLYNFSRTKVASGSTAIAAANLGYASAAPTGTGGSVLGGAVERSGNVTVPGSPLNAGFPTTTAVSGTWQSMSWVQAGAYDECNGSTQAIPAIFVRTA